MFPTKSLCFARSPKRSVTTPPSNTATRVSSRATVIAISIPILTPSIEQNRRTEVQDERGDPQVSASIRQLIEQTVRTLHTTTCLIPIHSRPYDSPTRYKKLNRRRLTFKSRLNDAIVIPAAPPP